MASRNLLKPNEPGGPRYVGPAEIMTERSPRLWSVATLIGELGLPKTTLYRELQDLPPDHVDGRVKLYHLARVYAHLAERAARKAGRLASGAELDPVQTRARKDEAQTRETLLRVGREERRLVDVDDAIAASVEAHREVAGAVASLGTTLAHVVAGESDPARIREIIDRETRPALESLAARVRAIVPDDAPPELADRDARREAPAPGVH